MIALLLSDMDSVSKTGMFKNTPPAVVSSSSRKEEHQLVVMIMEKNLDSLSHPCVAVCVFRGAQSLPCQHKGLSSLLWRNCLP